MAAPSGSSRTAVIVSRDNSAYLLVLLAWGSFAIAPSVAAQRLTDTPCAKTKGESTVSGKKGDFAPPEPEVFLGIALKAMNDYHQKNQAFPAEWHQLDISFRGGPSYIYRVGDPGTFPTVEDKNVWQPKDCRFRYILEKATPTTFRIVAVTADDKIAYEATEKTKSPRRLLDVGQGPSTAPPDNK